MKTLQAKENNVNQRLDKFLSEELSDFSRTQIQEYIDQEYIKVNSKKAKSSYKLSLGDIVEINEIPKEEYCLEAEDIPLDIVYEDDDLIVINKPKGLVIHPGAGNKSGTLANALKYYSDELSGVNGDFRPGIVHRLDKDTAGLLAVAKNDKTHLKLQEQLKDHTLGRTYYALVSGRIEENEGKIIAPIGRDKQNRQRMSVDLRNGKDAETDFKVIERFKYQTLVECKLKTGRTHQIRVHMTYIGHPVEGDPIYGKGNRSIYKDGQLLFAKEISFVHPSKGKVMTYSVPLPIYFEEVLNKLR